MTETVKLMTDLLAFEIAGKPLDSGCIMSDDQLKILYKMSRAHDVAHLVGDALIKNNLVSGEYKEKFSKCVIAAVLRYEKQRYEYERIKNALAESKIKFMPLKGSVIRNMYPEPWMRTSCDIDILVEKSSLDAAKKAVQAIGFEYKGMGSHDISLFSASGVHLELHYSLIEDEVVSKADKVLKDAWEGAENCSQFEYRMTDAMFYFYHIAHMAKHFLIGGCGVRPFIDIYILKCVCSPDQKGREELLRKGGLVEFAEGAEQLTDVWFCGKAPTKLTDSMCSFIIRGGVYGNFENNVAVRQNKQGGKLKYMLYKVFLPYNDIKLYFPVLEKHKVLLPFCEIVRWFRLLFKGGMSRSVKQININNSMDKAVTSEAEYLITALKL